jgi:Spy/CpxP family protein refolding chaperone
MHLITRAVLGALLCVGPVLLSVANSAATAAPSDLDETWGQNGVVMLDGAWLADVK